MNHLETLSFIKSAEPASDFWNNAKAQGAYNQDKEKVSQTMKGDNKRQRAEQKAQQKAKQNPAGAPKGSRMTPGSKLVSNRKSIPKTKGSMLASILGFGKRNALPIAGTTVVAGTGGVVANKKLNEKRDEVDPRASEFIKKIKDYMTSSQGATTGLSAAAGAGGGLLLGEQLGMSPIVASILGAITTGTAGHFAHGALNKPANFLEEFLELNDDQEKSAALLDTLYRMDPRMNPKEDEKKDYGDFQSGALPTQDIPTKAPSQAQLEQRAAEQFINQDSSKMPEVPMVEIPMTDAEKLNAAVAGKEPVPFIEQAQREPEPELPTVPFVEIPMTDAEKLQAKLESSVAGKEPAPMTEIKPKWGEEGYEAPGFSLSGMGKKIVDGAGIAGDVLDRGAGKIVDGIQYGIDGQPMDPRGEGQGLTKTISAKNQKAEAAQLIADQQAEQQVAAAKAKADAEGKNVDPDYWAKLLEYLKSTQGQYTGLGAGAGLAGGAVLGQALGINPFLTGAGLAGLGGLAGHYLGSPATPAVTTPPPAAAPVVAPKVAPTE